MDAPNTSFFNSGTKPVGATNVDVAPEETYPALSLSNSVLTLAGVSKVVPASIMSGRFASPPLFISIFNAVYSSWVTQESHLRL